MSSACYSYEDLRRPIAVQDLGIEGAALHHIFGADYSKRDNLSIIEDNIVAYASGNSVVFENILSGTRNYLIGLDEGGVGCITIHPSRTLFTVGGIGYQPNIYIYQYPSLEVYKVLKGGAERGYASLSFNADGSKLASVASSPDFMLTIWDWEEESQGLHTKAFGQDVYRVRFSLDDDRRLTTSGTGHIRFWKLAATFTGLKLQGSIGKFGKVELSDIGTFVELPDGKVVSGTETGSLLLWEGNFIKCRFVQISGILCHQGEVTYIDYDRVDRCLITAGKDGFIRMWDINTIDGAEVDSDNSMDFELLPVAEYYIGGDEPCGVAAMVDSGIVNGTFRFFVIVDTTGKLKYFKFSLHSKPELGNLSQVIQFITATSSNIDSNSTVADVNDDIVRVSLVSSFHAGSISSLDCCPTGCLAVTCGTDGNVVLWNYQTKQMIAARSFKVLPTTLRWVPLSIDPHGTSIAVGFADGVIRVFTVGRSPEGPNSGGAKLTLKMAIKPHDSAILSISFSASGKFVASSGKDSKLFIMSTDTSRDWDPIRFLNMNGSGSGSGSKSVVCNSFYWNLSSDSTILCSCSDNVLREFDVQQITSGGISSSDLVTYELSVPVKEVAMKVQPQMNSSIAASVADASSSSSSTAAAAAGGDNSAEGTHSQQAATTAGAAVSLPVRNNLSCYAVVNGEQQIISNVAAGQKFSTYRGTLEACDSLSREVILGVYSSALSGGDASSTTGAGGKEAAPTAARAPAINVMKYSWSKKFLVMGSSDGSIAVRPSDHMDVFVRVVAHSPAGVTGATCSFDDQYLLSTGVDGLLVVHKLRLDLLQSAKASDLSKDLEAGIFAGKLTKPVVSTASYLHVISSETSSALPDFPEQSLSIPESLTVISESVLEVSDEPDSNDVKAGSYSIQDAKLKSEEDLKRLSAEDLKDRVRASVQALQEEFREILKQNDRLPDAVKLSRAALSVDGDYWIHLEAEKQEMLAEVDRAFAYESEKAIARRKKMVDRLMNGLLVEELKLSSFTEIDNNGKPKSQAKPLYVLSLRTRGLDSAAQEIISSIKAVVKSEHFEQAQLRAVEISQRKTMSTLEDLKERRAVKADDQSNAESRNGNAVTTDFAAVKGSTAAIRRELRQQRKATLADHNSKKPKEDEDDIRDITAIRLAEQTMGDYKLKSGDDYEIPEEQRINATKKKKQMVLLEEGMVVMRLAFNERFLNLRELKRQIIYEVHRDNERIREIDQELGQPHLSRTLWTPKLDPEEYTDDRDEVTMEELEKYISARKANSKVAWEKIAAPPHSIITGTKTAVLRHPIHNTFFTVQNDVYDKELTFDTQAESDVAKISIRDAAMNAVIPPRETPKAHYEVDDRVFAHFLRKKDVHSRKELHSHPGLLERLEKLIPQWEIIPAAVKKRMTIARPTDHVKALCLTRRIDLVYERSMLFKKREDSIQGFREAINKLRMERHAVIANLKLAELRLLVSYQEYEMLLTFEPRDIALQQKQRRCQGERDEITNAMAETKMTLDGKLETLKIWQEKLTALWDEVKTLVPESNLFAEQLTKVFKKKIKRVKIGDDGNEDDNEDDDDDDDDDDDEEDDEEVEDACPPGCEPVLYEKIIELREKRLDIEEYSAEVQKSIDDLKKGFERSKQREKQIIKDSQQTELEVRQFQLQKQAALNQIDIVVPLKLSQIHCFEGSGIFSGPYDVPRAIDNPENSEANEAAEHLRQVDDRSLVPVIDMKSHVLFTNKSLSRFDGRIKELHKECDESKVSFKELHKERTVLSRDRESRQVEIDTLEKKCKELQMLKFGRLMELDDLEAGSDRTKELEAEALVKRGEVANQIEQLKLTREIEAIRDKLSVATISSTAKLSEVASLTEEKLTLNQDLNDPLAGISNEVQGSDATEREERDRIMSYIQLQAKEIESLRAEITMLKRKDAPPISIPSLPLPPQLQFSKTDGAAGFLPQIPSSRRRTPNNMSR